MKTLICIFILSSLGKSLMGQSLHAFLFCHTNNEEIKEGVRHNYHNFDDLTEQIAKSLGYKLIGHHAVGSSFNVERVKNYINKASISPLDIVIVYISSHGVNRKSDKVYFPLVEVPDASFVSSFGVYKELSRKNPKTLITIVEACNGFKMINDKQIVFLHRQSPVIVSQPKNIGVQKQNIQKLFKDGCRYIVCSGQPGMNTYATNFGSIFTNNFIRSFNEIVNDRSLQPTWSKILNKSYSYTKEETRGLPYEHWPVWSTIKYTTLVSQGIDDDSTNVVNQVPMIDKKLDVAFGGLKRKNILSDKRYADFTLTLRDTTGVDSVTYLLHHTFKDSVVTSANRQSKFRYTLKNVWGEFPIKAIIHYRSGQDTQSYNEIKFPRSANNRRKL